MIVCTATKKTVILFFILISSILFLPLVSSLKLCDGTAYPNIMCESTEKRIAQVTQEGCVKEFGCVDISKISGGYSRFTNLCVPKYELLCVGNNYYTEAVYRHTDLCQIGILCLNKNQQLGQVKCPVIPGELLCYDWDFTPVQKRDVNGCMYYECERNPQKYAPFPNPPPPGATPPYKWKTSTISGVAPERIIPTPIGNLIPPYNQYSQPNVPTIPVQPPQQPTPAPQQNPQPVPPSIPSPPQTPPQPRILPPSPQPQPIMIACGNTQCNADTQQCQVIGRKCVKRDYFKRNKCGKYESVYGCVNQPQPIAPTPLQPSPSPQPTTPSQQPSTQVVSPTPTQQPSSPSSSGQGTMLVPITQQPQAQSIYNKNDIPTSLPTTTLPEGIGS